MELTKLNSLNPLKTLEKGFGVIKKDEKLVRSIDDLSLGDQLEVEIIDGIVLTKVVEKRKKHGK
jgi:exodeoxyribonuclease VII large subunit